MVSFLYRGIDTHLICFGLLYIKKIMMENEIEYKTSNLESMQCLEKSSSKSQSSKTIVQETSFSILHKQFKILHHLSILYLLQKPK